MSQTQIDSLLGKQGAGILFERDITLIVPRLLEEKRAPLNAMRFLPVDPSRVASGADGFIQRIYDTVGTAKIVEDFGGDIPLAGAAAREVPGKVKFIAMAYQVTIRDMRQALLAMDGGNPQLPTRLARAAVRAIDEAHNRLAWLGDEKAGLFGALNHPNVAVEKVTISLKGAPGGGKTKADQLAALNALVNKINKLSSQTYRGRRALLPPDVYTYIATTPWSDSAGDTTILSYWIENNPFLEEVHQVGELEKAVGDKDRILIFDPDPDVLAYVPPTPLEQLHPQWRNLAYTVPLFAESAGTHTNFPSGAILAELA